MPLAFVTKGKDPKRRSKTPRGQVGGKDAARDEVLASRVERLFTFSWKQGIQRLRARVNYEKLEAAYRSKNMDGIMRSVPFKDLPKLFDKAIADIRRAGSIGIRAGERALPNPEALRFDISSPAIRRYINTTQGRLIDGVTEEFQTGVQQLIQTRFAQGMTTEDMAARLKPMLKDSIGLDSRSTTALANFRNAGNSEADAREYAERLYDRRAKTIARTEVAFAQNEGQRLAWDAAAEQGLIDGEQAEKVWVVDAVPCPAICAPMEGISVALGDDFLLPDGTEVPQPPAHPNCLCRTQLRLSADDEVPQSSFDR